MREDFAKFFKPKVKPETVLLDIGCGDKGKTAWARAQGTKVIHVDAWDKVNPDILCDVAKEKLPIDDKSCDIVLMYDFIEHLTKEEGYSVLKEAQRVCRGEIILVTPIFWTDNLHNVNNPNLWCFGNEYDAHKSLWMPEDFEELPGWERVLGSHDDTKYYLGVWKNEV